jgi:poly(A) polymerase
LVEQPRFRAGFDFLRLRADIEEVDERLADWWQEFSMANDAEREDLLHAAKVEQAASQSAKPRVRRAPRPEGAAAPWSASEPADVNAGPPVHETGDDNAPPKRRRRRRKPGGAGDAPGDSSSAE